MLFKRLGIWFWWNFIIHKNEFHWSLQIDIKNKNDDVLVKRQVAHLLDLGCSVFELPDFLVEGFYSKGGNNGSGS